MNVYNQIEARYGFCIPEAYRRLEANGWLSWSEKNPDYLWLDDGEWLTPDQILNYKFQEYHKDGFIPFAFTGGGDLWCWHPGWNANGITPVVFCPRDSYDGNRYAPNFLGWVFRTIVEFASSAKCFSEEVEAKKHFARWRKDVAPLLPEAWAAVVRDLGQKPMRTWPEESGFGGSGFISMAEANEIVQKHLAFPHLEEEIRWMIPVEKMDLSHLNRK